mgnify:CR=1 FL=1
MTQENYLSKYKPMTQEDLDRLRGTYIKGYTTPKIESITKLSPIQEDALDKLLQGEKERLLKALQSKKGGLIERVE